MMHLRGLATIALARIASGLTQASGLTLDRRALLRGSSAALAAPLLPAQAGSIPTWDLGGGVAMPTLALNTVGLTAEATERAVKLAVALARCNKPWNEQWSWLPSSFRYLVDQVRGQQPLDALPLPDIAGASARRE